VRDRPARCAAGLPQRARRPAGRRGGLPERPRARGDRAAPRDLPRGRGAAGVRRRDDGGAGGPRRGPAGRGRIGLTRCHGGGKGRDCPATISRPERRAGEPTQGVSADGEGRRHRDGGGGDGSPPRPELPGPPRQRAPDPRLRGGQDEQVQDPGAGGRPGDRGPLALRPDPWPGDLPPQVAQGRAATRPRPAHAKRPAPLGGAGRPSFGDQPDYALVTFSAAGPLAPWTRSNSTLSPSARVRKPSALMAVWWTKQSLPPFSGVMNPKPLASLNHFTVPVMRAIAA